MTAGWLCQACKRLVLVYRDREGQDRFVAHRWMPAVVRGDQKTSGARCRGSDSLVEADQTIR